MNFESPAGTRHRWPPGFFMRGAVNRYFAVRPFDAGGVESKGVQVVRNGRSGVRMWVRRWARIDQILPYIATSLSQAADPELGAKRKMRQNVAEPCVALPRTRLRGDTADPQLRQFFVGDRYGRHQERWRPAYVPPLELGSSFFGGVGRIGQRRLGFAIGSPACQ
ncbi:hypothetical protein Mal65_19840 [Crateriforma conspicua]|nr:hypothetical protein Mal65_19840 [Crateriforma conspicua]